MNYYDTHAYVDKLKKSDPDNPTFSKAMGGPDAEFCAVEAMQQEIQGLMQQRTWQQVKRQDFPPNPDGMPRKFLRGTWAFKLKRLPDGTPFKYKARYCCRGGRHAD